MKNTTNETKGMLLGLLGVIAFGLTLPFTALVVPYLDPIFIASGRAVVAGFFAIIILFIFDKQPFPNKKQFFQLILVALSLVFGFPILISLAMQSIPASHGGVVFALAPLMTTIIASYFFNEKPSIGFWFASVIGSVLVIIYSFQKGLGSLHMGDLVLFLAILSASIGYAISGKLSKIMGGWRVICWALVISFPFMLIPAIIKAPQNILELPLNVWGGFLYLALISQLLSFFFWNKGLALGGISKVSQTQLIQPFITIIASAILLEELIDSQTIIFAFLVVSAVAFGKQMPIYNKEGV